jgi:hypothetical protein
MFVDNTNDRFEEDNVLSKVDDPECGSNGNNSEVESHASTVNDNNKRKILRAMNSTTLTKNDSDEIILASGLDVIPATPFCEPQLKKAETTMDLQSIPTTAVKSNYDDTIGSLAVHDAVNESTTSLDTNGKQNSVLPEGVYEVDLPVTGMGLLCKVDRDSNGNCE